MRAYLIDEISPSDMRKVMDFLKTNTRCSQLNDIFWVQIPDDLLTETQLEHQNCRPHVFAIESGPTWLKFEFFVRSLKRMRCRCPGYVTPSQKSYVFHFAKSMLDHLGIDT